MKNIASSNKNDIDTIWKKITRLSFEIFANVRVFVKINIDLISICVYVPPFLDDSIISNVRNNVFESCLLNIQFQIAE